MRSHNSHMRRSAPCLLALLIALPAGATAARVPAAVTLGGMLSHALPAMNALVKNSPVPSPALLDTSRVAALISRTQTLPAPLVAPTPLRLLEAVNATLRDFTPNQIRDMPAVTLKALASVIMDGEAGRAPRADATAASALAEAKAVKIERLRGRIEETLNNPGHTDSHADIITARGVPENVRRFDSSGVVLRHYTTQEGLDAILREKSLWNGFVPYVEIARALYRKTYRDLTGVFLTLPKVRGDLVGVPAVEFNRYVDLRVSAGLPVLEIEKGSIYLIPLPGRTRDWIADLYRRWAAGGAMDSTYAVNIAEVERDGGPGPALAVPIEIVGHGRVKR